MSRNRRLTALALASALVIASCGGDDGSSDTSSPATTTPAPTTTVAVEAALADFDAAPGVRQITVTGALPNDELIVLDESGVEIASGLVDENGALLFRRVEPGDYRVTTSDGTVATPVVSVYGADEIPDQSFYDEQAIGEGFGYVEVRDGTLLSANVMLPGPVENGPYPTVVEYSGYSPSDPANTTFGLLFNTLGYAYVGVNMRGTGCSGGSYRFFEEAQLVDGYDVIEAIAAQDWVLDNEVGMVGISYPGISQLFVASTQPPSLIAITPISVLDDSYRSTLYPGGILNTGFAVSWTAERMREAQMYGQEWSKKQADEGDEVCAENQLLRLQNPDLTAEIDDNPFYTADIGDEINPLMFVPKIEVPVFMAGAWQDEQTGGHFPAMFDDFTSAPHLYVTMVNGLHTESLSPSVFPRMAEFLSLYVAKKTPDLSVLPLVAGPLGAGLYGTIAPIDATNRFEGLSYDDALAAFEAEDPYVVLFEQGAADGQEAASPAARWSASFDTWPVSSATATRYLLGDSGRLGEGLTTTGETSYVADPTAVPETFYEGSGSGIWRADVQYDWVRNPEGTAAVFTSDPFTDDAVILGPGSADLWITSSAEDTDLEVTLSEIRPDGSEVYIQSGWLRASHRVLDESKSTELLPVHTHLEADAVALEPGEITAVRVDIFPVAHPIRSGSRLRVTIDAPGGNRGVWKFRTLSAGESVSIVHDADHPSAVVLPIVSDLPVPMGAPACGALRGQPCRPS
jgi:predicted acyl esterase